MTSRSDPRHRLGLPGVAALTFVVGCSLACGGVGDWFAEPPEAPAVAPPPLPELPVLSDDPFAPPVPLDGGAMRGDPRAVGGRARGPNAPSLLQRAATRVRHAYVLKLTAKAPSTPRAGWSRIVGRLGTLGATQPFRAENEAITERLDLGRWRTFRSERPYEEVVSRLEQSEDVAWVEAVVRLAGTRATAEQAMPGVLTIGALLGPDDPDERSITSLVLAERLLAAVDGGASVVWVPWVGLDHTEVVAEACAYAREQGVTVVAPVGDQGYRDFVAHPAGLDTTIAVGALRDDDAAPPSGNQGAALDVVAPAADSLAASAEVARLLARLPALASNVAGPPEPSSRPRLQWRRLVGSAIDELPTGRDARTGYGRVDAEAAFDWPLTTAEPSLIVAHRVERRSGHRAVLSWVTAEPASTVVKAVRGTRSTTLERPGSRTVHRVVVTGTPGEVQRFAMVSAAGDRDDRRRVTVQF